MNVKQRQRIERAVIRAVVRQAIAAGYSLSVNDGEETTVQRACNERAILDAIMTTDEDWLLVHKDSKAGHFAWVRLVYGNDGWDVISDYTTNIEDLMTEANKVAERWEARFA